MHAFICLHDKHKTHRPPDTALATTHPRLTQPSFTIYSVEAAA